MTEDDSNITGSDFLADLSWQIAMGVDECISDAPINRYELVAAQQAARLAKSEAARTEMLSETKVSDAKPSRSAVSQNAPLGAAVASVDSRKLAKNCNSLEDLQAAVTGFEGCALKQTASNTVFGDGQEDADIMFVGEAPGADEDRQGIPFVGPTGQMLDQMLSFIGLDRQKYYITNALHWRPPGNRSPTEAEIATCLPFLERHIELVNPKLLVFVGNGAAKALLETNVGITRLRGKWCSYKPDGMKAEIPALPIFHPSYLLKNPNQKKLAWADMLNLRNKLAEMQILS